MRGTGYTVTHEYGHLGIIPACAGNSDMNVSKYQLIRDHPRVCGEQFNITLKTKLIKGSSPRVRGTGPTWLDGYVRAGIIPACAGNRPLQHVYPTRPRDHPRVCGEQWYRTKRSIKVKGSSPRVRGTAYPQKTEIRTVGIIPACAGNRARLRRCVL